MKHHKSKESGDEPCSAKLPREQDELAMDIACFLWQSSALRHGLFTPNEFISLAHDRLRQYFHEQNSKDQDKA